jgi:hypothetical protein
VAMGSRSTGLRCLCLALVVSFGAACSSIPKTVTVPSLSGDTLAAAAIGASNHHLALALPMRAVIRNVSRAKVLRQSPVAGSRVRSGLAIELVFEVPRGFVSRPRTRSSNFAIVGGTCDLIPGSQTSGSGCIGGIVMAQLENLPAR